MNTLSSIASLIIFIAGLVVLYKLFKKEGLVKAILGLICMLYTFIWGWQHIKDEELGLKNWMYVWTGVWVLGIILAIVGSMQGAGSGG